MIPTPALISGRISARLGAVEHLLLVEVVRIAQNDHYTRHQEKSERVTDTPANSEPHSKPAARWKGGRSDGATVGRSWQLRVRAPSVHCNRDERRHVVRAGQGVDRAHQRAYAKAMQMRRGHPHRCRRRATRWRARRGRSGSPGNNTL